MKYWQRQLKSKITVDEYVIKWEHPHTHQMIDFRVRYVKHNGYTLILGDHSEFGEWLSLHSEFNTRYDLPHWYRKLSWYKRDQAIVQWANKNLDLAFWQFSVERIDHLPNGN